MTDIHPGETGSLSSGSDNNTEIPESKTLNARISMTISPENFNEFTFSKKSHLDFFSSNNYDFEFLGQRIDISNINIKKYQLLLIYSFIKQNVKPGANILEISDRNESEILNHFKYRYDCYKTTNVQELEKKDAVKNRSVDGVKFGEIDKEVELKENHYDLVFCTSEYRNISEKGNIPEDFLYNINSLIKPGGYSLLCFENIDSFKNIWVNGLFFTVFNYYDEDIKIRNRYKNPAELAKDTELLYSFRDFSNKPYQVSKERIYTGKGNVFLYNILSKKKPLELPIRSKTRNENSLRRSPVYIFHHLMKCGGSSIVISLTDWFFLRYDLLERVNNLNIFMNQIYNTEELFGDFCLTGHFQYDGIHLHQRYPEMLKRRSEYKFFTFIRDPLKVKMSLYYYVKKFGGYENTNLSLRRSLLAESNFLASLFPCDESNYKEVLDRYFFIGIVEKMQESMDKLSVLVNKRKIQIPLSNTTDKDSQVSELTPDFLNKFRERNKLDYMIYDYCVEKFNKM